MFLIMGKLQGRYIEIFLISFIVLTIWEYLVGVFLEKVFKTKYWDYSDHKINFQGRICLSNSIAWGFLGVGFISIIHPIVSYVVNLIPQNTLVIIIYVSTAILILDTVISVIKINTIKEKLTRIQELEEEIKIKLKEIKENSKNKISDKTKVAENIQAKLKELKFKRNRMARKLYRYAYRIKRAFPEINKKEITQILNKKFIIKRNNTEEKRRK